MKAKILLLEDDINLSDTVVEFLEANNYDVKAVYDGQKAHEVIYESSFDLLLLDVKVPMQNGLDLLKLIRKDGILTPAIFITSVSGADDVAYGFDIGCDDYIRKPFSLKELLARIRAILKRQFMHLSQDFIEIEKNIRYHTERFSLYINDVEVKLTNKEARLLKLFLENKNKVITKEQIFSTVWDYEEEPNDGSLRSYIKTLRKHLGREKIESIKHIGYSFASK
ncbi:MAG: two-component system, OmpR family, response regulator CiaR [Campylobacterota bacterium]|nr:two-component system, OmpR family, response regulator CiaR [Campylobacterota bacterium]